jgi:hypothetical protein
VFERLWPKHEARAVFLYAFDLLELDGVDLRREPIETRKAKLASLLRGSAPGLRLNEHFERKMGLEGIVSKRLGSSYVSGRTRDWLKFKNPGSTGGKARGRRGLEQRQVAMTEDQRRWLYIFVLAIIGGAVAFLILWGLG